jgi:H+-transporting ATPase
MNSEVKVYAVSLLQTAFTRQKNFGKEAGEAQWATTQQTLHGLRPPKFRELSALASSKETLGCMADQAKRCAEIARPTQHLLQFFNCSL